jgi:hypothetical protein
MPDPCATCSGPVYIIQRRLHGYPYEGTDWHDMSSSRKDEKAARGALASLRSGPTTAEYRLVRRETTVQEEVIDV